MVFQCADRQLIAMQEHGQCKVLIEETADALKDDKVFLMLLAVQKRNLNIAIIFALKR